MLENLGKIWYVCLFLEEEMATHSSTLAWKFPWTEEPGRLQSMGSRRVGHNWVTSLSFIGEGNGNPLQCSCLENPRDGGVWWAAAYGVVQSRTRLKQLSSSSSSKWLSGKESSANAGDAGDAGSIPGLGKYSGIGHGNTLQYFAWEIP